MLICSQPASFPGSTALNTMWLLSGLQTLKGSRLNNEKKLPMPKSLQSGQHWVLENSLKNLDS